MALSANKFSNYKPSKGIREYHPVVGSDIIYRGALLMLNADGYATPASDTASCQTLGVALDYVDNSGGSAGDKFVLVDTSGAELLVAHEDTISQANVGDAVVLEDDDEVTSAGTGTNDIAAGQISKYVSANVCWIRVKPFGVVS
jgi:hypothetical protein